MEVVHGDIEIDLAAGGFDTDDHGFGIHGAGEAFFIGMNFRGGSDICTDTNCVFKGDPVGRAVPAWRGVFASAELEAAGRRDEETANRKGNSRPGMRH